MSDPLLRFARNPMAKKMVRSLGLPVPLPESLRRNALPYAEDFLENMPLAVEGVGPQTPALASALETYGGNLAAAKSAGGKSPGLWGLVYDVRGAEGMEALAGLYEAVRARVRDVQASGRVLVVGDDPAFTETVASHVTQRAWHGFVKSLGKELGRRGITVNGIAASPEATEAAVAGTAAWLLSPRAAFVSGQILNLGGKKARGVLAPRFLAGKTVLVTGAAQGIGAAITRVATREGAHVIALDRPESRGVLSELCRETGAESLLLDLAKDSAVDEIASFLAVRKLFLHGLVNNAGVTRDKTLGNMDEAKWRLVLGVNLDVPWRLTERIVAQHLAPGGRVVCLSSVNGIAGSPGQTNYGAAKAGVIGLTEALAPPLGVKGQAIVALAPGFIETAMTAHIPVVIREVARRYNALQQGGLPEDVAEAALFLLSEPGGALNGGVLRVCGLNQVGA